MTKLTPRRTETLLWRGDLPVGSYSTAGEIQSVPPIALGAFLKH